MRPRQKRNDPLPVNLYPNNKGTTYRYRHPVTGKFHGMGSDKQEAIKAAKELNSLLMVKNDLVASVLGSTTVCDHIVWFFKNIIPERDYKPSTIEMYEVHTKKLNKAFGDMPVEDITVHEIAALLEEQTPRVANQVRQVAVDIFKVALSRGLIHSNPADITLKRKERKQRKRLTLGQFKAIYELVPLWMQNAMDIALITLQRREDIANMTFDNIRAGKLYVVQTKTEKFDTGYLAIQIGPTLQTILDRCCDSIESPFIIHRKPERRVYNASEKEHWSKVEKEMITRTFAKYRDVLEEFKEVDPKARPTFHEIRALGIKLYRDHGKDPQELAGHATAKMTNNYDSDHEEIRWVEVVADLDIQAKLASN